MCTCRKRGGVLAQKSTHRMSFCASTKSSAAYGIPGQAGCGTRKGSIECRAKDRGATQKPKGAQQRTAADFFGPRDFVLKRERRSRKRAQKHEGCGTRECRNVASPHVIGPRVVPVLNRQAATSSIRSPVRAPNPPQAGPCHASSEPNCLPESLS
jgi:hypothetical protein